MFFAFILLHCDNISAGVILALSIIVIGLVFKRCAAGLNRCQSLSVSLPDIAADILTPAFAHIRRVRICISGISKENTAQTFPSSAACSTIFIANDVLPIPGRAANTIRSDFCKPLVILSKRKKPVITPRKASLSFSMALNLSKIS